MDLCQKGLFDLDTSCPICCCSPNAGGAFSPRGEPTPPTGFDFGKSELDLAASLLANLSWLLDSSSRYFGNFDTNIVRSRLCLLTGSTLNDAFNDNKLFIGGLYKIVIVFG